MSDPVPFRPEQPAPTMMSGFTRKPPLPASQIRRESDTKPPLWFPAEGVSAELREGHSPPQSYRIVFSTPTVKPRSLPEFAYVSKELRFDSVVYSAIVHAPSLQMAIEAIQQQWPDAQPEYAVEGDTNLDADQTDVNSKSFGARRYANTPFWRKLPVVGLIF